MALEPITRVEQIMYGEKLEPITREEMFLAKAAGMDVDTPEPITRREMFLSKIFGASNEGGGSGSSTAKVYIGEVSGSDDHLDVVHNLGTTDILLAACWDQTDTWENQKYAMASVYLNTNYSGATSIVAAYNGLDTSVKYATVPSAPVDENTFRFMTSNISTESFDSAAGTYTVVIVAA